eukprot:TRINITY_DN24017_c0_g1_i1.p1 TRINITY_DN24017_c0_g1~~TRINITY_DN24017_c0_g1_i1.p1  ORF type:complete len:1249 (-),score=245.98 TRINITY_DN24017_c0_g1_i1:62-3472(-)
MLLEAAATTGKANGGSDALGLPKQLRLSLSERLLSCVLPDPSKPLDRDATREQAAQALLHLISADDEGASVRHDVLKRATTFLAETPTPEIWNFEPSAPKEPATSPDARRNETGHVGLLNRGMTCYMNSTVQQLFWSLPFRNAVLAAPPPVADSPGRPEPLPGASKDETTRVASKTPSPEMTQTDAAWQLQKLFAYLQDCQVGQYTTDQLVEACRCLRLEYAVTSQNDASEFFDKMCDAADAGCSVGDPPVKPSSVFMTKTAREKHCLHCGFRAQGREDELCRVQLGTLRPTVEGCLEALTAAETMSGDNRVDCDNCGPKRDTKYQTFFTQLPQVLVLHLARITFDLETFERVKLNPRIAFPLKLNMSSYTEDAVVHGVESVPGCTYELQGVQVHMGGASSGHYYSFAQDHFGKWFKFNDDRVSPFELSCLEEETFGGSDRGTSAREKSYNAYMLFYRCVDASPYRSRGDKKDGGSRCESPTMELARSNSVQHMPKSPVQPPSLQRHITQAFGGERLAERQKRRRQAQMRTTLQEEIELMNTRLHQQAVVFSEPAEKLVLSLVETLSKIEAPDKVVSEGLCRLTAKTIFDIVLHSADCDERRLRPWVEVMCRQLRVGLPEVPRWLLSCFTGEPDTVLGRSSGRWLPKILFEGKSHGDRFLAIVDVVVGAAEAAAAGGDASACTGFFEALLAMMTSSTGAAAMARYGELWNRLVKSPTLRPRIAAHRGTHGSPVSSLLLHLYVGAGSTPLKAPPAPPLPTGGTSAVPENKWEAYVPLLGAVDGLLGETAELAAEPIVQSEVLWRAVAQRNPACVAKESPLRSALPEADDIQRAAAQAIIEGLRPSGAEDPLRSQALRTALGVVLRSGGDEVRTAQKLATLCEVGRDLLVPVRNNAQRGAGLYGGSSIKAKVVSPAGAVAVAAPIPFSELEPLGRRQAGGIGSDDYWKKKDGPVNPEALQLLRVLQVVASLDFELSEDWIWARDWLAQVCEKKRANKWQSQGLPMADVQAVRESLKGPGGQAVDAESEASTTEVILVTDAGTKEVNGEYAFSFDDDNGCPHYEQRPDSAFVLKMTKNRWGDIGWGIYRDGDALSNIPYYRVDFQYAEKVSSPHPPTDPLDWRCVDGRLPGPTLQVIDH